MKQAVTFFALVTRYGAKFPDFSRYGANSKSLWGTFAPYPHLGQALERRGKKRQRKEGRKKEEKEIEKRKGADRTGRHPFAGATILTDVGFKWMNLKSQITSLLSISGVPPVCPPYQFGPLLSELGAIIHNHNT